MTDCVSCAALAAAGVTEEQREVYPKEASRLEVFAPGEGHASICQLRRCPDCAAWYQYRHHYEFDMGGSWDEYYLWRLPERARALTTVLVDPVPDAARCAALSPLLSDPSGRVRAAASLAAWILAGRGHDLPVERTADPLEDDDHLAHNYRYRALLAFLRRGPTEAGRVLAAVGDQNGTTARILRNDARAVLQP